MAEFCGESTERRLVNILWNKTKADLLRNIKIRLVLDQISISAQEPCRSFADIASIIA